MANGNLLQFTKSVSGIELTEYLTFYIDQNVILNDILRDCTDIEISVYITDSGIVVYTLTNISEDIVEKIIIYIQNNPVGMYFADSGFSYYITCNKESVSSMTISFERQ